MWVLLRIGIFYENLSEGGVDMGQRKIYVDKTSKSCTFVA